MFGNTMIQRYDTAQTPQVLVVEDDGLLRMMAVDLVDGEHLTVFEADSADNALELLDHHCQIGIVFTDIQMPGSMDGLAMAHLSKARWPHLRHIIVSGQLCPTPDQMPAGSRFFAKPYDWGVLGKTIRSMTRILGRTTK
jgi:CheY-like chemotaxis protein